MSIAIYSDLQAAISSWTLRQDTNFLAQIPNFVTFAEQRILYGSEEAPLKSEPLRIRNMETSADLAITAGSQTVALPTGFLQQRRLYISATPNIEVDFVEPNLFWNKWLSGTSGPPAEFTVEGENLVFGPSPDTNYTGKILYYQSFTPLDSGNSASTNWLLTAYPAVYLWATLVEAYSWARNTEQAASALNKLCGTINSLIATDRRDRFTGPWTTRSDTGNP